MKIMVVKRNGKLEPFQKEKIVRSCTRAGATPKIAERIADEIAKTTRDKIPTSEIRAVILSRFKKENPSWEAAWLEYERKMKKKK